MVMLFISFWTSLKSQVKLAPPSHLTFSFYRKWQHNASIVHMGVFKSPTRKFLSTYKAIISRLRPHASGDAILTKVTKTNLLGFCFVASCKMLGLVPIIFILFLEFSINHFNMHGFYGLNYQNIALKWNKSRNPVTDKVKISIFVLFFSSLPN